MPKTIIWLMGTLNLPSRDDTETNHEADSQNLSSSLSCCDEFSLYLLRDCPYMLMTCHSICVHVYFSTWTSEFLNQSQLQIVCRSVRG